eukprot:SAG25_NODE_362_length_9148_cov_2.742513_5_plen_77_part_00
MQHPESCIFATFRKSRVDPLFRWEMDTRPKSVWDRVPGTGYHLQRTCKHIIYFYVIVAVTNGYKEGNGYLPFYIYI